MASITTASNRRSLKPGKITYRGVRPTVRLGYRRVRGGAAGTWLVRLHSTTGYTQHRLGTADDLHAADGEHVLSFEQAVKAASDWAIMVHDEIERTPKNYTVEQACQDYLANLEAEGRMAAAKTARYRINQLVIPTIGAKECADLKPDDLREWRNNLAVPNTRSRRATANRSWTVLRAALNLGFQRDKIKSDLAWKKVTPFKGVSAPRERWLDLGEARKLIAACEGDFKTLVESALHTGARYSELTRMRCKDFHVTNGTLHIPTSKNGKVRDIILTKAGTKFFRRLCKDRDGGEMILAKQWKASEQTRPMKAAVEKAKLHAVNFHALRHTWASLAVQSGVPLMVVAKNLGHTSTVMVERHYGHLAPTFVAEAIRAGAPQF